MTEHSQRPSANRSSATIFAAVFGLGLSLAIPSPVAAAPNIGAAALGAAAPDIVDEVRARGGGVARGPRGGVAVSRGGVGYGGAARRTTVVGPGGGVARRTTVVRPGGGGVYRGGAVVRRGGWARPGRYWWPAGGAIAAGAAIGMVTAATAAAWAGSPPGPGMCWYYTDQTRTQGFWDVCQ